MEVQLELSICTYKGYKQVKIHPSEEPLEPGEPLEVEKLHKVRHVPAQNAWHPS